MNRLLGLRKNSLKFIKASREITHHLRGIYLGIYPILMKESLKMSICNWLDLELKDLTEFSSARGVEMSLTLNEPL